METIEVISAVAKMADRTAAVELYKTTRSLTETMVKLRPLFNNDLDQLVVFMVFLLGPLNREASGSGHNGAASQGMNALSISQITGIARESTRRKLRSLALSGFITVGPDGLWRLRGGFGAEELRAELQPLVDVLARVRTLPATTRELRAA